MSRNPRKMFKIIVAPDSFKGCLSAADVSSAIAEGIFRMRPDADVVKIPLADGGEGTLDVLTAPMALTIITADVHDPLGRDIKACFGKSGSTALIEVAEACGYNLLSKSEMNPLKATSAGVGELMMAAFNAGCSRFIIGLGGSVTCDGGTGMLSVPGLIDSIRGLPVELLCDVDNPFVGNSGAARVFAPQKGASPDDVETLEVRMNETAAKFFHETGVDVSHLPGAGAAGGLGGAFMAYFRAKAVSGVDRILELSGFDRDVEDADLVITGEGRSDAQTLRGKVPLGVLRRSKFPISEPESGSTVDTGKRRPPSVALLSGAVDPDSRTALESAGFDHVVPVTPLGIPLDEALKPSVAAEFLREAAASLMRTFMSCL